MNEPHGISVQAWQTFSQAAVTALRKAGDDKMLWIEGAAWSQAAGWAITQPTPWITDPANNFMYSAHQYFVPNPAYPQGYDFSSYSSFSSQALAGLQSFIDWLTDFGVRGSIGEIGWPSSKETASWQQWNTLAEEWYELADKARLWVTYFSATSVYDEQQDAFDAPENSDGCAAAHGPNPVCRPPGISVTESQASVIEAHPSF
jgi:Cellulase (glycosyl hydrolase family 5)